MAKSDGIYERKPKSKKFEIMVRDSRGYRELHLQCSAKDERKVWYLIRKTLEHLKIPFPIKKDFFDY